MGLKETISDTVTNPAIQSLGFLAGAEGLGTLALNSAGYPVKFGFISESVKQGVNTVLEGLNINSFLTANPTIASVGAALGAGLLSNKVFKDLGLYAEGKTVGSIKNLARYGLNTGAMLWGLSAGTAAAPYLLAGGLAYGVGKYGWKYTGKALDYLWKKGISLGERVGKSFGNLFTETFNSGVNFVTAPVRGIYDGMIENKFLKPAPIKAIKKSVSE